MLNGINERVACLHSGKKKQHIVKPRRPVPQLQMLLIGTRCSGKINSMQSVIDGISPPIETPNKKREMNKTCQFGASPRVLKFILYSFKSTSKCERRRCNNQISNCCRFPSKYIGQASKYQCTNYNSHKLQLREQCCKISRLPTYPTKFES